MSSNLSNHQVRLAKRPEGLATRDNWQFTTEPVGDPAEGGVLVKTLSLSLDPAMRGWMNEGKSYIAPVEIGAVMRAGGVGRVVASRNLGFAVGDTVYGTLGVQEYLLVAQEQVKGLAKIDLRAGSITQWLNVLGMPGMTGYFGLMDVGQPKAGETVVVSGAAGAVGQTVGQLAKIKGCRAIGIAGGQAKCDWVVKELGFDACIDYKAGPSAVRDGLKTHCPKGIDIYFDNVGGEILDAALARLARGARIVICGAISQYNNTTPVQGPKNYLSLLVHRARMQGMVVFDYADRYPVAIAELSGYLKDGRMKSREDVVEGIDTFPEALTRLFTGENFGKLVLQVAKD
ncbi:Putative NADP-dependent oxidoreductase YfmJ [Variovorax sp. SRS16]|uniref:NADP-dependent oxidoreductase n=1 Tax=Variovorax sp. SRS16 TaxID=282217 RepID=UPI001318218D|nr:NADP-dependent oxidoreductase [Variovorax sp. SRS16]VTU13129.1 Putative NADP-dependent oxidoreductase YfmJ [Variovorax sp. SRS16]